MSQDLPKTTPETTEAPSREARVSVLAYKIWEDEGRPDGRHEVHWQLACEMVDAEDLAQQPKPAWLRQAEAKAKPGAEAEGTGDATVALPVQRQKRNAA